MAAPAARHTCSLPDCRRPADCVRSGHAYCPEHRAELNLVRVLATRLHRRPRPQPPRAMVPQPDPRRHR